MKNILKNIVRIFLHNDTMIKFFYSQRNVCNKKKYIYDRFHSSLSDEGQWVKTTHNEIALNFNKVKPWWMNKIKLISWSINEIHY